MEWYLLPWKRFADFTGRSRRKEYWMFTLFQILICFVLYIPALLLMENNRAIAVFLAMVYCLYSLAAFIPGLAVSVRRLHDTGKSGWFLLLAIIPLVGLIILVFMCLDSEPGSNAWGSNPKEARAPLTLESFGL